MQTEEMIVVDENQEVKTFEEIISDPEIIARIHALGITVPTPVQAQAVPDALLGKDLVVEAKTGSGKTITFCIPILSCLKANTDKRKTLSLIVTPTRELANQVHGVLDSLGVYSVSFIGGMNATAQINALKKDARVVVGTPGRILDMIGQGIIDLRQCKFAALDEADEMLDMGFYDDVARILSMLPKSTQGMFVSATISNRVHSLANKFLREHKTIVVKHTEEEQGKIEHFFCMVEGELMAKPNMLCALLKTENPALAIIFCNSKSDTDLIEAVLKRRGFNALKINSDLSQSQRNSVITKMRNGEVQYLVGTDIAARGLDIDQVELVINYSIHDQHEIYVHRTGRTGRAGRTGNAISLIGPQDFGAFHSLKRFITFPITPLEVAGF